MKKIQFISLFVLLFSLTTFTSCDDEVIDSAIDLGAIDDPNNPPNSGDPYFKADFSGSTWYADNTAVVITPNSFELVATRGAGGETFEFYLNGSTIGSYLANQNDVGFTPAASTYGYWGVNPVNASENTGSVTITNIDTVTQTVSGIFSYKGYWSDASVSNILPILFTNGVFNNLPYTTGTTPPPTGTDSFSTKINGTDFIDTAINVATVSNVITIAASNATAQNVTIGIRDDVAPGTYPITGNIGTDVVQASYKPNGVALQAYAGSVTIISKTATRIKGTFTFTTSDGPTVYQFTVGQFDVEY
ncbi:MAG: hypothetical protein V4648_04800 [Bacteroidota bacterium]